MKSCSTEIVFSDSSRLGFADSPKKWPSSAAQTKPIDLFQKTSSFPPFREGFKNPSNGKIPLRGYPPLSINFFPLTFWPAVVR